MKEDILRMFRAGISAAAISDATGVPRVAVVAILAREGLWKAGEDVQLDEFGPQVREAVLQAYRGFGKVADVCERYGLDQSDYWAIILEEGEPTRKRAPVTRRLATQLKYDEVCRLYQAGEKGRLIVDVCGLSSRRHLYEILDRRGIVPNRASADCKARRQPGDARYVGPVPGGEEDSLCP